MRKSGFALVVWALLGASWAAGCGSDEKGVATGGDAAAPEITGCNTFTHEQCEYSDVGCDTNTASFEVALEDRENLCEVSVRVECGEDGCISAVEEIPPLPDTMPDGSVIQPPPVLSGASPFGGPCADDADCDDGQICLAPDGSDWIGGGPSSGYCTLNCADDPAVCRTFPNSVCVGGASEQEAYCFEGCVRGETATPKCKGRADVACLELSSGSAACLPSCGSDNQCPEERFCDTAAGLCVDEEPQGDPIGTACDPAAMVDACEGFCMDFGDGFAICSAFCTVGFGAPACGIDPASDEILPGAPLCLPLLGQNDSVGDTGLCIQRCDCNGDCLTEAALCEGFDDQVIEADLSALGLCLPIAEGVAGLACGIDPDGGAGDGGTSDAGTTDDSGAPTDGGD